MTCSKREARAHEGKTEERTEEECRNATDDALSLNETSSTLELRCSLWSTLWREQERDRSPRECHHRHSYDARRHDASVVEA